MLHEGSFVDDPTRALRAARYAARFGFELEPEHRASCSREADLSTVSEDRIDNELRRIAAEEDPAARAAADRRVGRDAEPRPAGAGAGGRGGASRFESPWSEWVDRELAVMLAIGGRCPRSASWPRRPPSGRRRSSAWQQPWDPAQLLVARALGAEWLDRYAGGVAAWCGSRSPATT